MDFPIIWNIRAKQTRARRIAGHAFRIGRNALALLGVFFIYLMLLGYGQYVDQAAAQQIACSGNRCM
jgi:hypothetical protein